MAIFGLYYTKNMLHIMGWPRKQGLTKKKVINTTIMDGTIDQMVDWAAAIGAGNPKLALKIITYIFPESAWESSDAPQIKQFIHEMSKHWEKRIKEGKKAPHEIVEHIKFKEDGYTLGDSTITANVLLDKELQKVLELGFLNGLLFGLANPSSYEAWYKNLLKENKKNLPIMKEAGIDIDKLPSLSENYSESEQIISDYKKDMDIEFPSIPKQLLADAKGLGIKV